MKKKHTNEPNYTKLVMPRQLVLPLDYGMLIKETAPFYYMNLYNNCDILELKFYCVVKI